MECVATGADWSIIGEGNSASLIRRNIQLLRDRQLQKYGPKIKDYINNPLRGHWQCVVKQKINNNLGPNIIQSEI